MAFSVVVDGHEVVEPLTYSKALSGHHSTHWGEAICTELRALSDFGTWNLTALPPGKRALTSKWVFKVKTLSSGELERFKARLVVRGFTQTEGLDYFETYAPVAQYETVRLLLTVSAALDLECDVIDFSNAFLNGEIEEEIYLQIPKGFVQSLSPARRQHFEDMVKQFGSRLALRLTKALYGLKQACRAWNITLHKFLVGPSMKFSRSRFDTCLYFRLEPDGTTSYLLVYVDDTIIAAHGPARAATIKRCIGATFRIRDLGPIEWILKMRVIRNRSASTVTIDQQAYVVAMLSKFNMLESKPAPTPAAPGSLPDPALEDALLSPTIPYRAAVGSLLHAAIGTRFDIKYAVSIAARYSAAPRLAHWSRIKRIFRYLNGTRDLGLGFSRTSISRTIQPDHPVLAAHVDSDWGGDRESRRSTTGWILYMGDMPIAASSKLQPLVTLSSTEAEYVALCFAAQAVMAVRHKCHEAGLKKCAEGPTQISDANEGSIFIANNPVSGGRTKHVDIKFHYVREKVESQEVTIVSIDTKSNTADLFTKAVSLVVHQTLVPKLMTRISSAD